MPSLLAVPNVEWMNAHTSSQKELSAVLLLETSRPLTVKGIATGASGEPGRRKWRHLPTPTVHLHRAFFKKGNE